MQWNEKKTSGKLAYHEVFFKVTVYGESRTTDECEAFVGCCMAKVSRTGAEFYEVTCKNNTKISCLEKLSTKQP